MSKKKDFDKKISGGLEGLTGKKKSTPAGSTPKETTKGKGRPPATHGRVRFTTIIDPNKRDTMKLIALRQHRTISDVFDDAIAKYIAEYIKDGGQL